jgi:hypothetical protein
LIITDVMPPEIPKLILLEPPMFACSKTRLLTPTLSRWLKVISLANAEVAAKVTIAVVVRIIFFNLFSFNICS